MKLIYADYAAATPTDPRVVAAMNGYWQDNFANPSSAHGFGHAAWSEIYDASLTVSQFLHCLPGEVIYTSGGTESNNLAIIGVAKANRTKGKHIITTQIEHPSIINACRALEKDGWDITYLPVTPGGLVEPKTLIAAIKPTTVLISIHLANSELGVIQDISQLAAIARANKIYFHTDACQAAAYLDLDVQKLGVDLLTFNGGKVYGPKGIAVLYIRQGVAIFPIIYGGGQQESIRSGTENVPGIIGLAAAVDVAKKRQVQDNKKIGSLRDQLQAELLKLPGVTINATASPRLPNHLSVTFNNTTETNLVHFFDTYEIGVSSGSACSAKTLVDSHVLQAIGLTSVQIHKTVRISLGRASTKSDVNTIVNVAKNLPTSN